MKRSMRAFLLLLLIHTPVLASVIHVPADYADVSDAIQAALDLDTVLIADGTYAISASGGCSFTGKDLTVISENGPDHCALVSGTTPPGRCFVLDSGVSSACRIEGLSFRQFGSLTVNGAALQLEYASPVISNCRFWDCVCDKGTIGCSMGSPVILSCDFMANTGNYGAAVWADLSSVTVDSCLFEDNQANGLGGALNFNNGYQYAVTNCQFYSNIAASGSVMAMDYADVEFANCLLANNQCINGGTVYGFRECSPRITNCTFADNTAHPGAGSVYFFYYGQPEITNCILWNQSLVEIDVQECPSLTATYCCVKTGYPGTGNFHQNPQFVNGYHGGFYLSQTAAGQSANSPCLNSGADDAGATCYDAPAGTVCLDSLTTRTDHQPDHAWVDVGYHYPASPPVTPPPTSTPTAIHSPTQTPSVTPTPTPQQPTATPPKTATPVNTVTPAPTDTPPYPALGVTLELNPQHVRPGDQFQLTAVLSNRHESLGQMPVALVLDVYAHYFWYPHWTPDFDTYYTNITSGVTPISIFDFQWPDTGTTGDGVFFYGAILDSTLSQIVGDYGVTSFSWE